MYSTDMWPSMNHPVNTLRPRQNGRYFPDAIFKCIFLNENAWISLKISLKFVPKVRINNIPALVQMMAWRRPGDKPLSEPMMASLLTHICVTRPQWVNSHNLLGFTCRKQLFTQICFSDSTISQHFSTFATVLFMDLTHQMKQYDF